MLEGTYLRVEELLSVVRELELPERVLLPESVLRELELPEVLVLRVPEVVRVEVDCLESPVLEASFVRLVDVVPEVRTRVVVVVVAALRVETGVALVATGSAFFSVVAEVVREVVAG